MTPEHTPPSEIAQVRTVTATFQAGHASSILVTRSSASLLYDSANATRLMGVQLVTISGVYVVRPEQALGYVRARAADVRAGARKPKARRPMLNATDVQLGLGAGEDGDHMVAHVATRCSGRGIVSLRGLMARGFSHRLLPCQRMTGSIEVLSGSAHNQPNTAYARTPSNSVPDRGEQTHVSLESATRARLPSHCRPAARRRR